MRVWLRQKKGGNDLKKHYFLVLQSSLAVILSIFIFAFNINMAGDRTDQRTDPTDSGDQDAIEIKEVVQTKQEKKPPRPSTPQSPVEVPNEEIIESKAREQLKQLDQQVGTGQKMSMPPPPNKTQPEEKVFTVVEQEPRLIGGMDTLQQMIEYPDMARKAGIQGRVYVQFVVNKQGDVEKPKVLRGPGAGLNKEALRVVREAQFRPGIQQGHPVKVKYTMPIIFQLDSFEKS